MRRPSPVSYTHLDVYKRQDESLDLLKAGVSADSPAAAVYAVVSTQVRAGKIAEARGYLDGELQKKPKDPVLRLLSGCLLYTSRCV